MKYQLLSKHSKRLSQPVYKITNIIYFIKIYNIESGKKEYILLTRRGVLLVPLHLSSLVEFDLVQRFFVHQTLLPRPEHGRATDKGRTSDGGAHSKHIINNGLT